MFETRHANYDGRRAAALKEARGTLSVVDAAGALEMPVLRYHMLECGETEFRDGDDWRRAAVRLTAERIRRQR